MTARARRPEPGRTRKRLSACAAGALCLAGTLTAWLSQPAAPATAALTQATGAGVEHASTGGRPVWLCRPGLADDPCTRSLSTTSVTANGTRAVETASPATASPFDCFYVYPTVSTEATMNANLAVQTAEVAAARAQASPFSEDCEVWAPMYRQTTLRALEDGVAGIPIADTLVAFRSLVSSWRYFLAHDDKGRPIVLIGHSQGAALLIRLIRRYVDPDPTLRARTVMVILTGGNLQVPAGKVVGATFKHLPLCTEAGESGCVIAYSSFPSEPPPTSPFGRPGRGASIQSGEPQRKGEQVACVNPASLAGGSGDLEPYFRAPAVIGLTPPVTTPWVTFPDLYSAECEHSGDATWLEVTDIAVPGDTRPVVTETAGPTWGYHVNDISLSLGNLVADVAAAEGSYASSRR